MKSVTIVGTKDLLKVYEDKVVLLPKEKPSLFNPSIGERTFPFANLVSISFKEATLMSKGRIAFETGAMNIQNQQFVFGGKVNDEMVRVNRFIQERIGKSKVQSEQSLVLELERLKKLYLEEMISPEEFNLAKSSLLKKG